MHRSLCALSALALLSVAGCDQGAVVPRTEVDAGPLADAAAPDGGPPFADAGGALADDAGPALPLDAGAPLDAGPPPPAAQACEYRSVGHGGGLVQLDTGPGSSERLRFTVEGLPHPSLLESAELVFVSHDADHPGEEGVITVNGQGPFELPANLAWDNAAGTGRVDVLAALVAGRNTIEFGPGPLSRSFFSIGDVAIEAQAQVEECVAPPPPPPPDAVERLVHYRDAVYTNRSTWVIRCDDYAFTASGDEHTATDCDGGYTPGGNRRGTATFRFPAVVGANYEIIVRSRHTENRSPEGALFVVEGVERRICQRSDRDRTDDVWGQMFLEGDVEVVLDSTREGNSDSVISVRIAPM